MDTRVADTEEKPEPSATCSGTTSDSGALGAIHLLLNELYQLSYDRIWLAALETRRAGESLVIMIVAAVLVAFMLSSAWLGLMAVAILIMVDNGVVVTSATLLTVAFNLFLALLLCGVIRRKRRYLQFPATLRSFQPMASDHRVTEKRS